MSDEALIADLEARAAQHEAEARRYRAAAAALRGDISADIVASTSSGVLVAQVKPVSARRRTGPSTTMSMIRAVTNSAHRSMDAHEITDRMLARGWQTTSKDPLNTVRTALSRLVERGELTRDEMGLFAVNNNPPHFENWGSNATDSEEGEGDIRKW